MSGLTASCAKVRAIWSIAFFYRMVETPAPTTSLYIYPFVDSASSVAHRNETFKEQSVGNFGVRSDCSYLAVPPARSEVCHFFGSLEVERGRIESFLNLFL